MANEIPIGKYRCDLCIFSIAEKWMGIALRDFTFDPKQKSEIEKKWWLFFHNYHLLLFVCFFFQILRKWTCLKFLSKRKTIVIFFWSDSTRLIEINVWNLVVKHPSKFSSTYNVFVKLLMWLRTSESHVNCIGQFLWHSIHNGCQ